MRDFEVLTAVDCFNVNAKALLSSIASVTDYHSARHYTEETLNFLLAFMSLCNLIAFLTRYVYKKDFSVYSVDVINV